MNKVIKKIMVIVPVIIIALCVIVVISKLVVKKEGTRLQIIELRREVESLNKKNFYLEENLMLYSLYHNMILPDSIEVRNERGEKMKISSLIRGGKNMVVRISESHCISCIQSFNSLLNEANDSIFKNILYICDYETKPKLAFYKKLLNIKSSVYICRNLSLPIEKENRPYFFIIDQNLKISRLHLPIYIAPDLSKKYMQSIGLLKNNI